MLTFDELMAGADPGAPSPAEQFGAFLQALGGDDLDDALAQQVTPEPEATAQPSLDLGTHGTPVSVYDPAAEFARWAQL